MNNALTKKEWCHSSHTVPLLETGPGGQFAVRSYLSVKSVGKVQKPKLTFESSSSPADLSNLQSARHGGRIRKIQAMDAQEQLAEGVR